MCFFEQAKRYYLHFFLNFNLDIFLSYCKVFINEYEGIGMGLASTKILWRTIGATITAESQLGHGACFIFTLPAKAIS